MDRDSTQFPRTFTTSNEKKERQRTRRKKKRTKRKTMEKSNDERPTLHWRVRMVLPSGYEPYSLSFSLFHDYNLLLLLHTTCQPHWRTVTGAALLLFFFTSRVTLRLYSIATKLLFDLDNAEISHSNKYLSNLSRKGKNRDKREQSTIFLERSSRAQKKKGEFYKNSIKFNSRQNITCKFLSFVLDE